MEKLIIENRTNLVMADVLTLVRRVVIDGRESETSKGPQYCFNTVFKIAEQDGTVAEVFVSAFLNKKSDRLVVHYNDGKDHNETL